MIPTSQYERYETYLQEVAEEWLQHVDLHKKTQNLGEFLESQIYLLYANEDTDRQLLDAFTKRYLKKFIDDLMLTTIARIQDNLAAEDNHLLKFKLWLLQNEAVKRGILETSASYALITSASSSIPEAMYYRGQSLESQGKFPLAIQMYLKAAKSGYIPAALYLIDVFKHNLTSQEQLIDSKILAAKLLVQNHEHDKAHKLLNDIPRLFDDLQESKSLDLSKAIKAAKRILAIYKDAAQENPKLLVEVLRWTIMLTEFYNQQISMKEQGNTEITSVQQGIALHERTVHLKQAGLLLKELESHKLLSPSQTLEFGYSIVNMSEESSQRTQLLKHLVTQAKTLLRSRLTDPRILFILGEAHNALHDTKAANSYYLQAARCGSLQAIKRLNEYLNTNADIANLLPKDIIDISSIIIDPVLCPSGQTYERSNLERWFKSSGSKKEPSTGAEIPEGQIIPNTALSKLLEYILAGNTDILKFFQNNHIDYLQPQPNRTIIELMLKVGFLDKDPTETTRVSRSR